MSAHANPDIVTDGLAFIYDTGSGKSYKGEPTVNLTSDSPSQNGWNGTYSVEESASKTFTITTQQNNAATTSAWRTWYWSVSSHIGSYVTISADVEFVSETDCTFSSITIGQGNTGSFPYHITGSGAADRVIVSTKPTTQIRMEWSGIINATGIVGFTQWINNVTTNGANSVLRLTNVQIEVKSHATQFVNGTRSATQGLIDRTNNTTINLSNVSFDSNAQMVFDGTDDYTSLGNPTALRDLTSGTIETVYYRDASSGTYQMVFTDAGSDLEITYSSNTLQFYIGNSGLSYTHAVIDQWFNVVGTWGSGFKKLYINGAEVASGTNTGTDTGNRDRYVGGRGANFPFNGEIPIAKIYNKALTASEVLQNYNATKGRFS